MWRVPHMTCLNSSDISRDDDQSLVFNLRFKHFLSPCFIEGSCCVQVTWDVRKLLSSFELSLFLFHLNAVSEPQHACEAGLRAQQVLWLTVVLTNPVSPSPERTGGVMLYRCFMFFFFVCFSCGGDGVMWWRQGHVTAVTGHVTAGSCGFKGHSTVFFLEDKQTHSF